MDLIGNLVFISGKFLVFLFLIYIWLWLLIVEKDYLVFALLTIFMAAGAICGAREAIAEGA